MMDHPDYRQLRRLRPFGVGIGHDRHAMTHTRIPRSGVCGEWTVTGRHNRRPGMLAGLGRTEDGVIMDHVAPGEGLVSGLNVAELHVDVTHLRRLCVLKQPLPPDRAA